MLGLATIARFHGVSVDVDGLRRTLGVSGAQVTGSRLCCRRAGLGSSGPAKCVGRVGTTFRVRPFRSWGPAGTGALCDRAPDGPPSSARNPRAWELGLGRRAEGAIRGVNGRGGSILLARPRLVGDPPGPISASAGSIPYLARYRGPLSRVVVASLVLRFFAHPHAPHHPGGDPTRSSSTGDSSRSTSSPSACFSSSRSKACWEDCARTSSRAYHEPHRRSSSGCGCRHTAPASAGLLRGATGRRHRGTGSELEGVRHFPDRPSSERHRRHAVRRASSWPSCSSTACLSPGWRSRPPRPMRRCLSW